MKAKEAADKDMIQDKALEVFGSEGNFVATVMSATVRYGGGRLELGLLLWLEAGLALAMLPAHAASAALSLVVAGGWSLGYLCLLLGGRRLYFADEDDILITRSGMSRLRASQFNVWFVSDILIKLTAAHPARCLLLRSFRATLGGGGGSSAVAGALLRRPAPAAGCGGGGRGA